MKKNDLGMYFKSVRLYKKMTKKEAAVVYELSIQYLDKVEDQIQYVNISEELYERISLALDVDPKLSISEIDELNKQFDQYIRNCVFYKIDEAKAIYKHLNSQEDKIIKTAFFPRFLIIRFAYYVLFDQSEKDIIHDTLNILNKVYYQLDNVDLQIFYLYYGFHLRNNKEYKKSVDYFEKSLMLCHDELIQSTIYFYLSYNNVKTGQIFVALNNALKAKSIFEKSNNYIRNAFCITNIGLIYLLLEEFEQALLCFEEAIQCGKMVGNTSVLAINYANKAWAYINLKRYNQVAECANQAIDFGNTMPRVYYITAFSYLKLGDRANCRLWLDKGLYKATNIIRNDSEHKLFIMLDKIAASPKKELSLFIQLITYFETKNTCEADLMKVLYLEIIERLKEQNNYKEALMYYERMKAIKYTTGV